LYQSLFAAIGAVSGVSTTPGPMTLTRTPWGASSAARVRHICLLIDGKAVDGLPQLQAMDGGASCTYNWTSDGKRHWVRAELDNANGEQITLTNPIYVNWNR